MEIRPGEKKYERTADKDIFIEYSLKQRNLSMSALLTQKEYLVTQEANIKSKLDYPTNATTDMRTAIDNYNKTFAGTSKTEFQQRIADANALINLLNALPPYVAPLGGVG